MINKDLAMKHLMDLLAVPGPTGQEAKVVEAITKKLISAGCKKAWIKTDDAHKRLGDGYEIGNLIVQLPGTVKTAPRIMFSAHMDTVPLCKGAVPMIKGNRVVAKGNTGLGGDDRSGCAALVTLCETILTNRFPTRPSPSCSRLRKKTVCTVRAWCGLQTLEIRRWALISTASFRMKS
ncbi:hypothetical protein P4E94_08110 [Pontiellaceae bacterium B12219]|nr:hypothetical protein [Pontiellaceae bacterium B12219]